MSSPHPSEGIAAIAAKIQDRASQLLSERRVLELVQAEQEQQEASLDEELEVTKGVRQKYLAAIRSRHGVEMELGKIETQKKDCHESILVSKQEIKSLQEHKQEIKSDWEDLAKGVLADHHLNREVYRFSIQATIEEREKQMLLRNNQLAFLAKKTDQLQKDCQSTKDEKKRIEQEIESLNDGQQREDEEVSNLSLQVRDMVAKRANARKKLKAAKHAYAEANKIYSEWEKECCDMANKGSHDLGY